MNLRTNLLHRFSVLSAVAVGTLAVILALILSWAVESIVLERARADTANTVLQHVPLSLKGFDLSRPVTDPGEYALLQARVREIGIGSHIVRVKIWNSARQVVYSDNRDQIGKSFKDNDELNEALGGEVEAEISGLGKAENAGDRGEFKHLMELYVPVRPGAGAPVGNVFEVYQDLTDIDAGLARARWIIWGATALGMLILYLALFGIVRSASHTISKLQAEELALTRELRRKEILSSLGELSAVVAHEIKNPLSIIRGSAETLRLESSMRPEDDQLLGFIVGEVDRLNRLVGSLLDFARPRPPQLAPTDIHASIDDALKILSKERVQVNRNYRSSQPVRRLDPGQLRQVLINLIRNAEESVACAGGEIAVTTEDCPTGVRILVEDNGRGVPSDQLPRVFLPFHTSKTTGSGLGLAIARKLVDGVGGTITLENRPQGGARACVTLP